MRLRIRGHNAVTTSSTPPRSLVSIPLRRKSLVSSLAQIYGLPTFSPLLSVMRTPRLTSQSAHHTPSMQAQTAPSPGSLLNHYGPHLPSRVVRPPTAANRGVLILKTPKNVDFLSTAVAPVPLAPDPQNTRRVRMTWRPPVSECRGKTTCLRPNVLTGHTKYPQPNATESKTPQLELQRTPQPTSAKQKRATNRRNQKPLLQNDQERTNSEHH